MALFSTSIPYTSSDLESNKNVYISESATGVVRQRSTVGQVYAFNLKFRKMLKAEAFPILAFFESNVGSLITLTHPQHLTPLGSAGGTPLVNGASQTGSSLVTDGWTVSTTVLKAGDIISIGTNGSKVYRVTSDVTSDVSGNATINIFPDLISSPANNANINHTGVLFNVVMKNKIMKYNTDNDNIFTYEIAVVESL